jgi:hypothetical protein
MAKSINSSQVRKDRGPTQNTAGDRVALLGAVDTNIKLFGLVVLVMEAGFAVAITKLPNEDVKLALIIMAVVGTAAIIGGVWLHRIDSFSSVIGELNPSPRTITEPLLSDLVWGAIETVCRAVSLPKTLETARLRVFIFRADGSSLVCTHFWSPNPTQEAVGLRFDLRPDLVNKVAVVDAALSRQIVGTEVKELPSNEPGIFGGVSPQLKFILAAPIFDLKNNVWGVVDFDTSTSEGASLLQSEIASEVMFQLARHLRVIFTLGEDALRLAS